MGAFNYFYYICILFKIYDEAINNEEEGEELWKWKRDIKKKIK